MLKPNPTVASMELMSSHMLAPSGLTLHVTSPYVAKLAEESV